MGNRPDDYRWKKLRARFKAYHRARNSLCYLCVERGDYEGALIDYRAKPQSPNAFEADHKKSWVLFPHLRYEWNNLGPSHSRCNRQRQAGFNKRVDTSIDVTNPVGTKPVWIKPSW